MSNSFMGKEGFVWWIGVLESRADPLNLGRAKIRIFGWHSDNKTELPTTNLPWAHPLLPLNNATPKAPPEGTWIMGYFMDGENAQYPVMMGIVPGIPSANTTPAGGFSDPRSDTDLANAPRPPQSVSGGVVTEADKAARYPRRLNEPATPRLARGVTTGTAIEIREQNYTKDIGEGENAWVEPPTEYGAKYPYNHVTETESGHVMEFDDTPGAERIHLFHRTGTYMEIGPSGTKAEKIVKDRYEIVLGDDFVYIKGKETKNVDGSMNVFIKGDVTMQVDGNKNETVNGDYQMNVGGSFSLNASDANINASGSTTVNGSTTTVKGGTTTVTGGSTTVTSDGSTTVSSSGSTTVSSSSASLDIS